MRNFRNDWKIGEWDRHPDPQDRRTQKVHKARGADNRAPTSWWDSLQLHNPWAGKLFAEQDTWGASDARRLRLVGVAHGKSWRYNYWKLPLQSTGKRYEREVLRWWWLAAFWPLHRSLGHKKLLEGELERQSTHVFGPPRHHEEKINLRPRT